MFKYLEWDTDFFGFRTALLLADFNSLAELDKVLLDLRKKDYRLAYLFTDPDNTVVNQPAITRGTKLVDEKCTFSMLAPASARRESDKAIEIYPNLMPSQELIRLVIKSDKYSRLKTDNEFPAASFEKLYIRWIIASTL